MNKEKIYSGEEIKARLFDFIPFYVKIEENKTILFINKNK